MLLVEVYASGRGPMLLGVIRCFFGGSDASRGGPMLLGEIRCL